MIHIDLPKAQELFKQAFIDLYVQGAYGYSHGICEYQTADGKHCIFGLVLKRLHPELDLTGLAGNAQTVIEHLRNQRLSSWDQRAAFLAMEAQSLHGWAACRGIPPARETLAHLASKPLQELL